MDHKFILHTRRNELMRRLQKESSSIFVSGMLSIYEHVKKHNKVKKHLLKEFQKSMVEVSVWSQEIIKNEHKRFLSLLPTFDKLVHKIFETQLKLHEAQMHQLIDCSDFMHQCYLNIARSLWKQPFLVYDIGVDKVHVQRNKLKIEKIVLDCIKDTFDHFIPLDDEEVLEEQADTEDAIEDITNNANIKEHVHEHNRHNEYDNIEDNEDIDDDDTNVEDNECNDESDDEQGNVDNVDIEDNVDNVDIEDDVDDVDNVINVDIEDDVDNVDIEDDVDDVDIGDFTSITSCRDVAERNVENNYIKDIDGERNEDIAHIVGYQNHDFENNHHIEGTQQLQKSETKQYIKCIEIPEVLPNIVQNTSFDIDESMKSFKNVKLVSYDEKVGKVKSLLALKKKVKSSMLNSHINNPSFF